jgi:hypothetical protein
MIKPDTMFWMNLFLSFGYQGLNQEDKMINLSCDYVINTENHTDNDTTLCHIKGVIEEYECLHPPSTKYNQHGGEYGNYIGPEGS